MSVSFGVSGFGRIRAGYAVQHLLAAARFASRVRECEEEHQGEPFGAFWDEILQHSIGVVTLCVASLEAFANELVADVLPNDERSKADESECEAAGEQRDYILTTFSAALTHKAGTQVNRGQAPFQDVATLIRLRNAIVHFQPEWIGERGTHTALSARLKGRLAQSPFLKDEPLFPYAWATGASALWAVRSTSTCVSWCYGKCGLSSPVAPFEGRLSELLGSAL